jgi:hypothetical protein
LPEALVTRQPFAGVLQLRRVQPAVDDATELFPFDQAGTFEHPQVLRDRGQGHHERLSEFADRELPFAQLSQDGAPRGVGERRKGRVQGP